MCLSSLVGVRGLCESTATYPYFINDIPGINLKNAANISDTTGVELLTKSINNAANQVKSDIQHEMIGLFRLNEKIKPFSLGNFTIGYTSVVKSGFHFEQICDPCRFASYYISSVDFQPKEDFSGKVVIEQGNEVTEISAIGNANIKTYVTINKLIQSNAFKIYLVNEDETSFDLLNTTSICYSSDVSVNLIGNGLIKLNGYWQCDIDRLFCELKDFFPRLVWLASGAYFFEELSMTDRINYYSVYKSADDAMEQKHILIGRYHKELKTVVSKLIPMLKKMDKCCIDCTGSGWKYQLP
jgi:hypothetical protein